MIRDLGTESVTTGSSSAPRTHPEMRTAELAAKSIKLPIAGSGETYMQLHLRKLCILSGFLLTPFGQVHADSNSESTAASILFDRFETVFHASREIVSSSGAYKGLSPLESSTFRYPFRLLLGALDSLGKQAGNAILENGEGVLVGAKDFRAPVGLGPVASQLCYVVILKNGTSFEPRTYFKDSPADTAGDSQIWHWSANLNEFGRDEERPSSLYAAKVGQSYFLVSNNLTELKEIALRLSAPTGPLPILSKLPEWESARQHQFWGYRRYHHTGTANPVAAGTQEVTPGAEALIFFVDFDKKLGVVHLINSLADEGTAAKMNARAVLPRFEPRASGIWESVTKFSGDEDSFERMVAVMYFFGFGVYA
ncbi:MAG TPA: hypothetical protein VIW67_06140 [Terriglobales bacterium]